MVHRHYQKSIQQIKHTLQSKSDHGCSGKLQYMDFQSHFRSANYVFFIRGRNNIKLNKPV